MISTFSRVLRSKRVHIATRALLVYMFLFTLIPSAYAQEPADADQNGDDNLLEVRAWYVGDYEDCGGWGLGDLGGTYGDATSLAYGLGQQYWFAPFGFTYPTPVWNVYSTWGNGMAWESDWKRSAKGGNEEYYVDAVDLAYFSGHGSRWGFFPGVGGNRRSDCIVDADDAAFSWGTRDNDWIGIAACNLLDGDYGPWANAINGTRLLMGYQTVMADVNYGSPMAWYIRWGHSMSQAWFRSANDTMDSRYVARIMAEDWRYMNDTWANHNSFTVVDNDYWVYTHRADVGGSVAAAGTDAVEASNMLAQLGGEMPIYSVTPLGLEEAQNEYAALANAWGISDTVAAYVVPASEIFGTQGEQVPPVMVSENAALMMDATQGTYSYVNPDSLWNVDEALANAVLAAEGTEMRSITGEEARGIADQFLENSGLGENQANYIGTGADVLTDHPGGKGESAFAASATDTTSNYVVNYERQLTYQVPGAAEGEGAALTFNVVGPGSQQSVYVAATVPLGLSAAEVVQDSVLGGQGGYRNVAEAFAADGNAVTVTMLPTSTIETLFNEVEQRVSIDPVPLVAESKTILQYTPTYYEGPMGMNMDQLIPVYDLLVEATSVNPAGGAPSTQQYHVFIPVNSLYMKPYAEILSPVQDSVRTGDEITLTAADASLSLADLGYDDSLNLVMGSGGLYTYDWYQNVVTDTLSVDGSDGKIGSGISLEYTVESAMQEDGKASTIKLILVVTDTEKNGEPRTAQADLVLSVNPVYLPRVGGSGE